MKSETVVAFGWNCMIPLLSGAVLATVGVAKKYPTAKHYVFTSLPVWFYILFCGSGSVVSFWIMKVFGTRVVSDFSLNEILCGVFAGTAFLGIVKRVPLSRSRGTDLNAQLKTLYAYVYEFVDDSVSRRVTQAIELRIKGFPKPQDRDGFLQEVDQLIAPLKISKKQRGELRTQFDELAGRGDYRSIIRELMQHYDVDHVISMLTNTVGTSADGRSSGSSGEAAKV